MMHSEGKEGESDRFHRPEGTPGRHSLSHSLHETCVKRIETNVKLKQQPRRRSRGSTVAFALKRLKVFQSLSE